MRKVSMQNYYNVITFLATSQALNFWIFHTVIGRKCPVRTLVPTGYIGNASVLNFKAEGGEGKANLILW